MTSAVHDPRDHPREFWMWGCECAIGTKLYWHIHYKAFRYGQWTPATPYACSPWVWALEFANQMKQRVSIDGGPLYREVTISGPHVTWEECAWKYKIARGNRQSQQPGYVK
jgi:hypothetical protein